MKYLLLASLFLPFYLFADPSPTEVSISAALDHERRGESDRARDKNRAPLKTLEFLRFEKDMTVLELLPGGGWYTKILGPVLEEKGKLYLSIGTTGVSKMIDGQSQNPFR